MLPQVSRCTVLFVLLLTAYSSRSQTRIEKLRSNANASLPGPRKLKNILAFCDEWESYRPDTLRKYAEMAAQLARANRDQQSSIHADYFLAVWLFQVNKVDTAFALLNRVITNHKSRFPYDRMRRNMYGLKANILLRTSRMDELHAHAFDWMKESEKQKDTLGMARAALGVGNVNSRLKKYDETLRWYHYALGLMKNPEYKKELSFLFNNISIIFYHLGKEDSARYYISQGIRYSKEKGNLTNLANALSVEGGLLAAFGHLKEAEASFREQVEVRKRIGDVYYLIADMAQLAIFYASNQQPEKGIAICREAMRLAEKNGNDFQSLNSIYSSLAKSYQAAGDHKGLSEALLKQLELKDSIYQQSSAEAMAEMQTKYETQKKENTIIQQELALVSKNYQLYGSLLLLGLVVIFSYLLFRQYKRKQALKLQLLQEEEKRRAEKAVAEAEEAERKRIAADLHDSLGAYAASIVANIDHIRLRQATENDLIALHELKNNSLAIVSQLADTIWALKKDALSLTAISDRIKVFVQRIQSSYPEITIDVTEKIETDYLLAPSQAFHLFQIVKEAINNALRHSQGTALAITVQANEKWKINISDNGEGMAHKVTITDGGNGLINMKSRARESGWNIEWQANDPKGTLVVIEPTTN